MPSTRRHLLGGVVGGEAVLRSAPAARPALAADGSPVEDHEVARCDRGDVGSDGLDDAGRLVAEQERELVIDPALPVVQIGVAHAAGLDTHERLSRAWVGDDDRSSTSTGAALCSGDDAPYLVCHLGLSFPSASRPA